MIDDLARELARPIPRRRALRLMAGALLAAGVRPAAASAASCGALGCNGKCCSATDWRIPGLQGVCCDQDEVCCGGGRWDRDPDHTYGWCCPAGSACGEEIETCKAVCKAPSYECGTECCNEHVACCPAGFDEDLVCCADDEECLRMIKPGMVGITADSPTVCCPEERVVTALTVSRICCPPGSVRQPGGGLSTAGGLCCTEAKVCGSTCCDSTPSFPKLCVDRKRCEFAFLLVDEKKVAYRDGAVRVPVQLLSAGARATISVVAAGGGGKAAAAAKPETLGSARLRGARPGYKRVRVKLTRRGRKLLRRRGKLKVLIVVTVRDGSERASTETPVTLRRD